MSFRSTVLLRAAVAATALAAAGACSTEKLSPATGRTSSARTLGLFSTELEPDPRAQAVAALERDARRRELRFVEVTDPGYTFRATRVEQLEIERGMWSSRELFELGAQLFHQRFRREDGFGSADLPAFGRFQRGERGGPDGQQCADCHRRGGIAGAGDSSDNAYPYGDGERPAVGLERNPTSLAGLGYLELLAGEMTATLAAQRAALFEQAKATGAPARGKLEAKGIDFGHFTARPDGTVDTAELRGVQGDLVVRPFGRKGHTATIREMVESELATHHGMQSDHFVATASVARKGTGPLPDPDGDGVVSEIVEGQVTALTTFLAMQEAPVVEPPVLLVEVGVPNTQLMPFWNEGAAAFRKLGCAKCHVPELELDSAVYTLPSRSGGPPLVVDLAKEGAAPRLARNDAGRYTLHVFTDLKRHDMGPALADAFPEREIPVTTFVTPPLWGVARSRPYLHDGRAPTLEDAILMHGGEAQEARDAYAALDEHARGGVRVFLTSLNRARRFSAP